MTNDMEYKTYTQFWTTELSKLIKQEHGNMDLIYAANCICHIHDLNDTFSAVRNLLSADGIFVFEDPSLLRMMERGSYDQLYDEHAHIFSVTALNNLLKDNGLEISFYSYIKICYNICLNYGFYLYTYKNKSNGVVK